MKKIMPLIILGAVACGIYYWGPQYFEKQTPTSSKPSIRGLVFSNFKVNVVSETAGVGLIINAEWKSRIRSPLNSSVYMECVATEKETGYGKRTVIAKSEILRNLTNPGGISCRISKKDIPKDRPYLWVKISSVINRVKQRPIVELLGKYN